MSTSLKKISTGRAWLAGVLITLGVFLAPTAIVAHWATTEIASTRQFVETLAPLAKNPAVQKVIVDQVTTIINEKLDIPAATDSLLSGLGDALNLPSAAKDALGLVSGPVASGVKSLISNVVGDVVKSDAFEQAWTKTLTLTQTQVVALLEGNPNSMLTLKNDGTISLPLKPLIQEVKAALVNQGVSFASAIPEIDTSVVIAKVPELALARVIYQIGVGVGAWLPWVVLGLLAAGVFAANRRPRALLGTSIAVGLLMGILAIGFGTGGIVIAASIDPAFAAAAAVVYDAIVVYVLHIVGAIATLAVILGFTGWAFGDSVTAGKFRGAVNKGIDTIRGALDHANIPLENASPIMHRFRVLARIIIVTLMGLGVVGTHPLNSGAVIGFSLLGVVVLAAYEILQRSTTVIPDVAQPVVVTPVVKPVVKPAVKKPAAKPAPEVSKE